MLIDTHAHLDMPRFSKDREEVIAAAQAQGIIHIVDPGCDIQLSKNAIELAQKYPHFISAGVGVHPQEVLSWSEEVQEELSSLSQQPGVVAIGECGLDYYRMFTLRELQIQVLRAHIALALARDLPIILHVRDAFSDIFEILQEYPSSLRGVFHCFTGTLEHVEHCLSFPGFYISFSGLLTKPETGLQDVAKQVPLDRVLVETDSPFLVPASISSKRNEPQYVSQVARYLADAKGMPYEAVAIATTQNAIHLFRLPVIL